MTRIAVFGAGAIGCYVGGRLAAGGADVTLIGRARMMAELEHGLVVTEFDNRWNVTPKLATEGAAADDADLVLVTVKSAQTADAGAALAGTKGVVISLQNGIRNAGILREALPGRTVLAGMVPFNVAWIEPGHYHRGTSGELIVEASPSARAFADACRAADLPLVTHADILAVQWSKLVMNLNNAINALSGRPLMAELEDRDFRRCLAGVQREALEVLDAAHQPVAKLMKLSPRMIATLLPAPNWLFRRVAARVASVDPLARSSMSDDFAAGRATEIDYLQGEIVALATKVGRAAPKNAKLVELVRAAERGGKRDWSGRELLATLTAPTA